MQRLLYCSTYLLLFLISSVSNAQSKSDTLFLKNGETILINANHSTFKNAIKYEVFSLDKYNPRLTIPQNQVQRIGINPALLNAPRIIKNENNSTKIYLTNNLYVQGKLLAATDSSLLILHRDAALYEANVKDINALAFRNKNVTTLSTIVGGVLGLYLGQAISSRANPDSGISNGVFHLRGITLGTLAGVGLGAIIGHTTIKISINRQKDQFDKGLKKLKFRH